MYRITDITLEPQTELKASTEIQSVVLEHRVIMLERTHTQGLIQIIFLLFHKNMLFCLLSFIIFFLPHILPSQYCYMQNNIWKFKM